MPVENGIKKPRGSGLQATCSKRTPAHSNTLEGYLVPHEEGFTGDISMDENVFQAIRKTI
jgi:hypothetical protein